MAKTNLKRMNRFELLELMYNLVKENEELHRRCERLERKLSSAQENSSYPSAYAPQASRAEEDEPYRTRREEVMQRMMEQSYTPAPQKPARQAAPARADPGGRTAPQAKPRPAVKQQAQPSERAVAQQPRARPAPEVPQQAAERPVQPQAARSPAPAKQQARPKPAPKDNLDLDSILQEYFDGLNSE